METEFVARCHCNKVRLHFSVPSDLLPLPADICCCSICRRTHGTLALYHAKIPSRPTPNPLDLSIVTRCRVLLESGDVSTIDRLFCSNCGTHIGEHDEKGWFLSTSIVEGGDETVFEHRQASYVPSTIDGGSADWLNGSRVSKWRTMPGDGEQLVDESWKRGRSPAGVKPSELLDVHFQCRGVSFKIIRPDWDNEQFISDYPDLVLPDEDETKRHFMNDVKNGTWWIASDRTKYRANACFCTSCTLSSGAELHNWVFVPTAFIKLDDGAPFKADFGTLKHFESSPNVWRRFCGTCGALVFYHDVAQRPHMVDAAVGLLDAPSGSRAEEWLSWSKREPSYISDAENKKLAEGLRAGYLKWAQST